MTTVPILTVKSESLLMLVMLLDRAEDLLGPADTMRYYTCFSEGS